MKSALQFNSNPFNSIEVEYCVMTDDFEESL